MENSKAYSDFIKQIHAVGRNKLDGYDSMLLENIYDWERESVEDIIWNAFIVENDSDMAMFMPKLYKYNGLKALKTKLNFFQIPSGGSVNIAETLYIVTSETKYLDIMVENYKLSYDKNNKISIVSKLSRLAMHEDVYNVLISIYVNDIDDTNQISSLCGILWADGYLNEIDDFNDIASKMDFLRMFKCNSSNERSIIIKKYQDGGFKSYKI